MRISRVYLSTDTKVQLGDVRGSECDLHRLSIRAIPASQKNKQAQRLHCYKEGYPFICLPCTAASQTKELLFPHCCHVEHVFISVRLCSLSRVQSCRYSVICLKPLHSHRALHVCSHDNLSSLLLSSHRSSSLLTPLSPALGEGEDRGKLAWPPVSA